MNRQLWVFLVIFAFTSAVYAQENQDEGGAKSQYGDAYDLHIGPLLPNQIQGMREIMPTLGARYAYPLGSGHAEFGIANANAQGTSYYNGSVSFRGDFSLDDIHGLVFIGLDTHYYNPPSEPYQLYFGGHVGGGFAVPLGDRVWFRSDMKFNLNPGTALYIGFGFEMRMPGGGGGGAEGG